MESTATISNLENLVRFESTVKQYKIKSQLPVTARIFNNESCISIEQDGFFFIAKLEKQIIHQLAARIFMESANEYAALRFKWTETLGLDKESLQHSIAEALRRNELTISYYVKNSTNIVYGIVSDAFMPINQIDFRNLFINAANKTNSLDMDSKFVVNRFGNLIEQFDFKSNNGRIKLSYLLNYARNNGYNAIRVMWGRIVIVCSNGLTQVEDGDRLKYFHLKSSSIAEFVNASLREGLHLKIASEERINRAINQPLHEDALNEFMNRLHLTRVSKERVTSQLRIEINETGNNEWALSQALTWLGTHEKHLMIRPKELLTEAGSMILDHSLEKYLQMDTHTIGAEKAYGALLPKNHFLLNK